MYVRTTTFGEVWSDQHLGYAPPITILGEVWSHQHLGYAPLTTIFGEVWSHQHLGYAHPTTTFGEVWSDQHLGYDPPTLPLPPPLERCGQTNTPAASGTGWTLWRYGTEPELA